MRSCRPVRATAAGLLCVLAAATPAAAQDTRVSAGSPRQPVLANKQNEPAIADRSRPPERARRGRQRQHRHGGLQRGRRQHVPVHAGRRRRRASTSRSTPARRWTQPTYTGNSARSCLGAPGDSDPRVRRRAPARSARCPTTSSAASSPTATRRSRSARSRPRGGGFSLRRRLAGSTTRTSPRRCPASAPFKGDEAIAVSHTDDVAAAIAGAQRRLEQPGHRQPPEQRAVLRQGAGLGRQRRSRARSSATSTSATPQFRGSGNGFTNQPLAVLTSRDGGDSWTQKQVTPATNNIHSRNGFGRSGCTVRTDSHGVVYVFDFQFGFSPTTAAAGQIQMIQSFDGGAHLGAARGQSSPRSTPATSSSRRSALRRGRRRRRAQRPLARPVGRHRQRRADRRRRDRPDRDQLGRRPRRPERRARRCSARSTNGGASWATPRDVETAGRPRLLLGAGDLAGRHRRLRSSTTRSRRRSRTSADGAANDRPLVGVVLHADVTGGAVGAFSEIAPRRRGRRPRLLAEQPRRRVPRRLRLRGAPRDLRRRRLERRARRRRLPGDRRVPPGAARARRWRPASRRAEPEEPRGAEDRERDQGEDEGPRRPTCSSVCPATFGNSDIFGGSWPEP